MSIDSTETRKGINRREFFSYLSVGWIAFAASVTGMASLIFRFLYPNVVFEPAMDFIAGKADSYDDGVDERWKNNLVFGYIKMMGKWLLSLLFVLIWDVFLLGYQRRESTSVLVMVQVFMQRSQF